MLINERMVCLVACVKPKLPFIYFIHTVVESYELTGRHIYLPMAITAGCVVVMLLSLVALYRNLAPIPSQGERQIVTSATSKTDILEQDTPHGTY